MTSLKLITATDIQYSGFLLKSINDQRNAGLFCDVTIIVQDRKFRAHKNILSASSSYFHQLFSVAGQVIELNFVKAEIFEEILNYIYSSKLCRIRSDRLQEVIQAGQTLGVQFISNLGVPLSQVRGLPGLSKVPDLGDALGSGENAQTKNDVHSPEAGSLCMPIITETFSLSAEEFKQTDGSVDKEGNSTNDDVLLVSKEAPENASVSSSTSGAEGPEVLEGCTEVEKVDKRPEEKDVVSGTEDSTSPEAGRAVIKEDGGSQIKDVAPSTGKMDGHKSSFHSSPTQIQIDHSVLPTPLPAPPHSPMVSPNTSTSNVQPPMGPTPFGSLCTPPAPSPHVNSSHVDSLNSPQTREMLPQPHEVLGVQKKQVTTVLEKSSAQPGDFKIKLSDVRSGSGKNGPAIQSPKTVIVGKKTITLDKASEIDSLSTGCKVYANIGENTYDIVPMKEDPGEGDSKASRVRKSHMSSSFSPDSSPQSPRGVSSKKKTKLDQDDHYELIMDGKTFYVCVVCKRPYVCLTSLRRHFNTHSWEKKYPCRYCDKVFALAEYRTKHEIYHTGERRYQCLLCNEFFINYQLLSSHCKQVHNQDPSGRKEKDDTENNLYRLLPCKTLQFKPYSYVSENSAGIPVINEEGIVYHVEPGKGTEVPRPPSSTHTSPAVHLPPSQSKVLNWDDIFVEPGAQPQPQPQPHPQPPAPAPAPPPAQPQPRPQTHVNPAEASSEFEFVIPETY
ncbi:transcriptional regulator Kaiso [Brienomyrus brachyistius]|uniref:transcriptional regulator Kaiso n=1 Tax=Brienomyrus brachyistius TaxID=42636 RepID=UPI0020B425CB|nr:transcriptional regulator Kaiso [Brienomyrus brachyistius]